MTITFLKLYLVNFIIALSEKLEIKKNFLPIVPIKIFLFKVKLTVI